MINITEITPGTRVIIHNYEGETYTGYITAEVIEIKNGELILADRVIKEEELKNIEIANEENLDKAYDALFSCYRTQAEKYLAELDLKKFSERKILTLSGGEFQRAVLARALTQETKIILLDEPTSALDLNHALDLMEKIKKSVREKGLTAVVVIHDLNLASIFCDEIIMLKEGKVFSKGIPQEVFTEKNLKEVYDLDCSILTIENNIPYIVPKIKNGAVANL